MYTYEKRSETGGGDQNCTVYQVPKLDGSRTEIPAWDRKPQMSSVEARLKEREEARRAAAERRRAERETDRRPEEAAGYFSQQFAAKKAGAPEYF